MTYAVREGLPQKETLLGLMLYDCCLEILNNFSEHELCKWSLLRQGSMHVSRDDTPGGNNTCRLRPSGKADRGSRGQNLRPDGWQWWPWPRGADCLFSIGRPSLLHLQKYELSVLSARTKTVGAQAVNFVSKLLRNKNCTWTLQYSISGSYEDSWKCSESLVLKTVTKRRANILRLRTRNWI